MNEKKWLDVIDKIQMDSVMKQRLYSNCIKKGRGSRMKYKFSKIVFVASISICILISVPIIAGVTSHVLERMQTMDKKEIQFLNNMIQEQPPEIGADSFSRELTEEEIIRKSTLLEEYTYKGKFPENEVSLIEGDVSQPVNEVCYNVQNSKFYLPDAPLTDEELLQIIDFNHKRDYSLQVINKVEQSTVNMNEVTNMGIVEKAQYIVDDIYNIDSKNLEAIVECQDEDKKAYSVVFSEGGRNFSVGMEGENLKVKSITADLKNELNTYQIVTREIAENETVLYKKCKNILKNIFNIDQEIRCSRWRSRPSRPWMRSGQSPKRLAVAAPRARPSLTSHSLFILFVPPAPSGHQKESPYDRLA